MLPIAKNSHIREKIFHHKGCGFKAIAICKAVKGTRYCDISKRNIPVLKGIGIIDPTRTTLEETRTTSAPLTAPETTQNQDFRTTRTTFPTFEKNIEKDIGDSEVKINLVSPSTKKEDYPPQSGAGGAEPLQNKENCCGNLCESGAAELKSGAEMPLDEPPSLLERFCEVWNDPSKIAELIVEVSPEEVESALDGCTQEQINHVNNIAIEIDKGNQDSLYPPGIFFGLEQIDANVESLKEAIADSDWEVISVLTANWKPRFKKAVWAKLSEEERQSVGVIDVSAESFQKAIADSDSDKITEITANWNPKFKRAVWAKLSEQEQESAKELAPKSKHQDNDSENKAPEPVNLHPAVEQKDEPTSLLQIERDGEDVAGFIGYQVEVRFSNNDVRYSGQIACWDDRNGIITVSTEEGDETAYPREVFLINSVKPT